MTQPTSRSAPQYRAPVAAGQTYPALGFGDDGTPRYTYDPPSQEHLIPVDLPPETEQAPPPPEPPRRDPVWRTMAGVASVLLLVLVVAGGLMLFNRSGESTNEWADRRPPPVSQPLDDPYLDEVPDIDDQPKRTPTPDRRRQSPVDPGDRPTDSVPAEGEEVTYTVDSTGPVIVTYMGADGIDIVTTQAGTWTETFTGTARRLQLTVVADPGVQAGCRIEVGGKIVNEKQLPDGGDSTALRSLTCRG